MGMGVREKWTSRSDKRTVLLERTINQLDTEPASPEICVSHSTSGFYTVQRCFYLKKMTGERKRRAGHFQKGHKLSPQKGLNVSQTEKKHTVSVRYCRPTAEEAKLVDQDPIQPLALQSEDSSDQPTICYKLLRSRKPSGTTACDANAGANPMSETSDGYRLFHTRKLWDMVNTVVKQHSNINDKPCAGNLGFDYSKEAKWGTCWLERVVCDSCAYTSGTFKLYEEVESDKPRRGRKAATANRGLSVGLTQTSAGPSSIVKLYASCNIPPPTRHGLQKSANKVSQIIRDANKKDMQARRQQLKTVNRLRNKPEHEIVVQSDGQYNNNLYSGAGKTPFQPGTQCTYTVAENVTGKKQIIAIETVNKLCSKHGFHTQEDEPCDIKSGPCSSTASMETCIGDEEAWATACLEDLKEDGLEVRYIVTDADTAANRAAEKLYEAGHTKTKPHHQIDTRHLSQSHRKFMKNSESVLQMMPGHTKAYRLVQRNRFAVDLSARCHAEHTAIHNEEQGDFEKIVPRIARCVTAIKWCYSGDHRRCKAHSSVCKGENRNNWIAKSAFLTRNFKINLALKQNEETLADCIGYRLNDDMLQKTRMNLNSQKAEATNRTLRMSLPKNVTFSRNFEGRAHSAVHSVNNGPGDSLRKLCAAAGCPITEGSPVDRSLTAAQLRAEKDKQCKKSMASMVKRKQRKNKVFALHEKHREPKRYIKEKLLRAQKSRASKVPRPTSRSRSLAKASANDHMYARTRSHSRKRQRGTCSPLHRPVTTQ